MSPAGRRQRPCRWGLGQVLAVLLALAAILAGGALGLRQLVTAQYTTRNKPSTDDEIYTGSILFPSSDAIKCHQFLSTIAQANSQTTAPLTAKRPTTKARHPHRASGPPCGRRPSATAFDSTRHRLWLRSGLDVMSGERRIARELKATVGTVPLVKDGGQWTFRQMLRFGPSRRKLVCRNFNLT